jgi:hypothetical protein
MKVKINKSRLNTFWYANCIGEVFEVKNYPEYRDFYDVVDCQKIADLLGLPENDACGYCLEKADCEIVEEENDEVQSENVDS